MITEKVREQLSSVGVVAGNIGKEIRYLCRLLT